MERDVQHAGDVVQGEGVAGRVLPGVSVWVEAGWYGDVVGVTQGVALVALTGVPCVYATVAT